MSATFDIDHNRLFGQLEQVLSDGITQLKLDANGGNSILFVYPNDEDALYSAEAKQRYRNSAIFVDIAKTLTDFQESIGIEEFKELEEELGVDVYYRKGATDTFFEFLIQRLKQATTQGLPVFLVGTSAMANKGFHNIDIMEHAVVKAASVPLVFFYPSTQEGDKIYFLGDHNHVASQYRCRVIK